MGKTSVKHAYIVGFMGKMSAKHVIGRLGIAQAIMHYVYNYDSVILRPNPPSEPPTHRLRSSTSTHYLPSILLGFRLDFGTGRSTTAQSLREIWFASWATWACLSPDKFHSVKLESALRF